VRLAVEHNLAGYAAAAEAEPEPEPDRVQLAAPWPAVYDQPAAPPPVARFDPWSITMRNPANRVHTLGHKITHRGPCTAACYGVAGLAVKADFRKDGRRRGPGIPRAPSRYVSDGGHMVVMAAPADAVSRQVVIMSASEASNRFGALCRYIAAGCTVRVDDLRLRQTVAWVAGAAPDGIDPGGLPAPGEAEYLEGPA
jgi:hypothetical protein